MEGDISKSGDSRGELQEEQRATPVVSRTRLCRINFDNVSLILKPHTSGAIETDFGGGPLVAVLLQPATRWVNAQRIENSGGMFL